MPCKNRPYWTHTKLQLAGTRPCNQCLECRIANRDYWVARNLLEFQSSIGAQFWTLTFSDSGLETFHQKGAHMLLDAFLKGLRKYERSKGNTLPIRCFGCLEHGSFTGRPHYHLILYNQLFSRLSEQPYRAGLPRPRYQLRRWRHGHVDCCPVNTKSMRYVAKYVSKLDQFYTNASNPPESSSLLEGERPDETINFLPRRPKLGLLGLRLLLDKISRSPARNLVQEPIIELDGRRWALPPSMYPDYQRFCREFGLNHGMRYDHRILRKQEAELEPYNFHEEDYLVRLQAQKERLWEHTHRVHELREASLLHSAVLSSHAANSRSSTNPNAKPTAMVTTDG